jgi:hypothetical protein
MPEFEARWTQGPSFAEVAEALKVDTDHVCAAMEADGVVIAIYNPEGTERGDPTYRAFLARGSDRVLTLARREEVSDFWEGFEKLLRERDDEQR